MFDLRGTYYFLTENISEDEMKSAFSVFPHFSWDDDYKAFLIEQNEQLVTLNLRPGRIFKNTHGERLLKKTFNSQLGSVFYLSYSPESEPLAIAILNWINQKYQGVTLFGPSKDLTAIKLEFL